MTVAYECKIDLAEYYELGVTQEEVEKAKIELEKNKYCWYQDEGSTLVTVEGEVDVDPDYMSAEDVEKEIVWIFWDTAEMDVDVETREIEYEPDWDRISGYDDVCCY